MPKMLHFWFCFKLKVNFQVLVVQLVLWALVAQPESSHLPCGRVGFTSQPLPRTKPLGLLGTLCACPKPG